MQHPKCCMKNLVVFKFDPKSSNMLQHITTYYRNRVAKHIEDVGLKCCECLARPFVLFGITQNVLYRVIPRTGGSGHAVGREFNSNWTNTLGL